MSFRILSLDGGGVRGAIAASILAEVEKWINQPLNQYFDLIAGTSTGSLLAAAIATGRSSSEIIELYKQKSSIIFPYESRWSLKRLPLIFKYGVSAPKYADEGLIQVLQTTFGQTTLFDVRSPMLLIVSYDTIERSPIIFKNWRKDKQYGNPPLWEVCVCSSSAPTYFPAHKLQKMIEGRVKHATDNTIDLDEDATLIDDVYVDKEIRITDGTGSGQIRTIKRYEGLFRRARVDKVWQIKPDSSSTYLIKSIYSAIDGGVAANNPSSCAVAEALRLGHQPEEITVLSIGTGDRTRIISFKQAQSWGLLQWAQPLIGVLFDGSSNIYEYISKQILGDRLLRLQFQLDRRLTGQPLSDEIDNTNHQNLQNLIDAARVYANLPEVQADLQRFLTY